MALPLFKSLRFFVLDDAVSLSDKLEQALTYAPTQPILDHQLFAAGFVQGYVPGTESPQLVFNGNHFFRLHVQSRKVNKDAVARLAAEKIRNAEERKQTLEEKAAYELALVELTPKFPVSHKFINAALSVQKGRLYVEGSDGDVDLLVSKLRSVVVSMPGFVFRMPKEFAYRAAKWVMNGVVENGMLLGDEATFEDNENATISVKKMKLHDKDVIAHLANGFRVKAMAFTHPDDLSFSLNKKGVSSKITVGDNQFLSASAELGADGTMDPVFLVIIDALGTISDWLIQTFPPESSNSADETATETGDEQANADESDLDVDDEGDEE